MSTISVGVIGGGKISSFFHLPILNCFADINIHFIADVRETKNLSRCYSAKSIIITDVTQLPKCDVILLATPVTAREPYISEYGSRNTSIFSEKPFAVSTVSHKALMQLTDRITCNYHRVFYSSIHQIKQIISSGIFGKLIKVVVNEGGVVTKAGKEKMSYQNNPNLSGGGILIESGCHTISQFVSIFDLGKVSLVKAAGEYQDAFDVDVQAQLKVETEDSVVQIYYHLSAVRSLKTYSEFYFDSAKVGFDHTRPDSILNVTGYNSSNRDFNSGISLMQDSPGARTNYQAFYKKWESFFDIVRGNSRVDKISETSLVTTQIINDIYTETRPKEVLIGEK